MNEIMPVLSNKELQAAYWEGYRTSDEDAMSAGAKAQNEADRKWMWKSLLAHKVYQRKYEGQLQIMFGFSPDELAVLREARDEKPL